MADDPTLLGLDIPTAIVVSVLKRDLKLGQTFAACGFAGGSGLTPPDI